METEKMNIELNNFQKKFTQEIEEELLSRNIQFSKKVIKNDSGNYVLYNIRHVQAFIYCNEAQIQGPRIDERYEPVDFINDPLMVSRFVNELLLFIEDDTLISTGLLKQIQKWILNFLKVSR